MTLYFHETGEWQCVAIPTRMCPELSRMSWLYVHIGLWKASENVCPQIYHWIGIMSTRLNGLLCRVRQYESLLRPEKLCAQASPFPHHFLWDRDVIRHQTGSKMYQPKTLFSFSLTLYIRYALQNYTQFVAYSTPLIMLRIFLRLQFIYILFPTGFQSGHVAL